MGDSKPHEIEARAKAAAIGPWLVDTFGVTAMVFSGDRQLHEVASLAAEGMSDEDEARAIVRRDAAFIAKARVDVPDLCSDLRDARTEIAALRASVVTVEKQRDELLAAIDSACTDLDWAESGAGVQLRAVAARIRAEVAGDAAK